MYKRIARLVGMSSIAILSAALVSVASAAPTNIGAPEPRIAYIPPIGLESRKAAVSVPNASPMHREMKAALSQDALDFKGYEKSLYRGKYYEASQESFRRCVMKRESHHNYRAANKSSSARGAYQFLDNSWRTPLTHMMIKESKKNSDGLIPKIRDLRKKPIHKWNRYFQDRAFFTAMNYAGKWSGKKHWRATVPGTGC